MTNKKWTEQNLIEAVKNNISLRQTILSLGLCGRGGGSYKHIQQKIKELNLSTSHWLGQGHLKGKSHNWNNKISLEDVLVENSTYSVGSLKERLIKENILLNQCAECLLLPTWNNKKLVLQLDHINGVHNDNRIENLRLLCPNCHSQTETFCRGQGKAKITKKKCPDCDVSISDSAKRCFDCAIKARNKCTDCKITISEDAQRCKSCAGKEIQIKKIKWPPVEILEERLKTTAYTTLAKELGVSDNAIRKHIKNHKKH